MHRPDIAPAGGGWQIERVITGGAKGARMGNGVGKGLTFFPQFDGCRCDQVSAAQGSLESFETVRNRQVLNHNLADWRCARLSPECPHESMSPHESISVNAGPA